MRTVVIALMSALAIARIADLVLYLGHGLTTPEGLLGRTASILLTVGVVLVLSRETETE